MSTAGPGDGRRGRRRVRRGDPDAGNAPEGRPAWERLASRRRRRVPSEDDLHYGAATRQQARRLGIGHVTERLRPAGGDGRGGAVTPEDAIAGWPEAGAPTGEHPIADGVFGLRPEPPGTGEHRAVIPGVRPAPPPARRPGVRPEIPGAPPAAPPGAPPAPGAPPPPEAVEPSAQRASMLVAAGILLSRLSGLLREVVIGRYLGTSTAADAFKAALRIPNLMQNLLGEGVLSASFIPVYARLRAEREHEVARRVAGSVAGLLVALTGGLSLIGVLFAEPITRVIVFGYGGERFDLTVDLVRIMFPGIGFLVLSAWCLGVLNSHRRFFLSYVAPVLWNAAQIAVLVTVALSGADQRDMAVALAWGVLAGGVLQFGIQMPSVLRLLGGLRLSLSTSSTAVRSVLARFAPVVMGRGVVQIMGYVDLALASFLAAGGVASLTYAQVLYLLPISVFGMSVAAAELPSLSSVDVADPDRRRAFRRRMEDGMSRILFYVAPTATLFIVVGDVIVQALFLRGAMTRDDTVVIWFVIAAFSLGLPAMTTSRLLQNALYALDDARTPARLAALRVIVSAAIGLTLMFPLDRLTVVDGTVQGWGDMLSFGPLPTDVRENPAAPHLGILGLAFGAAISAWMEYRLLSTAAAWRIGRSRLGGRWLGPIATACIATALIAYGADLLVGGLHPVIVATLVLGAAGATYLGVSQALGIPEADAFVGRALRAVRRR